MAAGKEEWRDRMSQPVYDTMVEKKKDILIPMRICGSSLLGLLNLRRQHS
jgi:hypothetical protein